MPQDEVYDNGPINGNTDAWTINSGFVVSDTLAVPTGGAVGGLNFGAWLFPGDVLETAEISISSQALGGGTIYLDNVVSFTQSGCSSNQYGFNVCTETSANFNGPELQPGTYWVNLQNAVVSDGDPLYWDENSGVGCESQGCPSQAEANSVGTIPSEAFTVLGSSSPPPECFQSHGNLQTLFSFTQQQAGSSGQDGVVLDQAGNLYGAFPNGGDHNAGFVFKLTHLAEWLLDPLFNFSGGNNGGQPTGLLIGPNGTLYGGAQGGLQNCGSDGSQYCGLVFNLTPPPTACHTALCGWNENVIYRFTSESDGSGAIDITSYDQQGNLYGTTYTGGAFDGGTVFELTPSGNGWTKTTLYSFTPYTNPTQVLVGTDGNLYGITNGNDYGPWGIIFKLSPSNGQWNLTVLYFFSSLNAQGPYYLVQDGRGDLFAALERYGLLVGGTYGGARPGGPDFVTWPFPITYPSGPINNITADTYGNIYGTAVDIGSGIDDPFIFKAWTKQPYVQDLYFFGYEFFPSGGTLAFDESSGNLYGTTNACGSNNAGTVWQLSP